jgi:hypothetical protein
MKVTLVYKEDEEGITSDVDEKVENIYVSQ